MLSHSIFKVLPVAKRTFFLPQTVLPCFLSAALTSWCGSASPAAAAAPAAAPAAAAPAAGPRASSWAPSRSGAAQAARTGSRRTGGPGDPWEPLGGAFGLLMASQVARKEAEQKEESVWSLLLQLQIH